MTEDAGYYGNDIDQIEVTVDIKARPGMAWLISEAARQVCKKMAKVARSHPDPRHKRHRSWRSRYDLMLMNRPTISGGRLILRYGYTQAIEEGVDASGNTN